MLSARLASSIVFYALFFLGLFHRWFWWVLPLLLAGAAVQGLHEFLGFGKRRPSKPLELLAWATALALLADGYFNHLNNAPAIMGLMTILSLGVAALRLEEDLTEVTGKCLIGTLYVTLPLALIMTIAREAVRSDNQNGQHYIIFLVLVTQMGDTGAYFAGRLFGRHKLAPRLSPGKTVEGLIGGIVLTVLFAAGMKLAWNNIDRIFTWAEVIALAVVFTIVGVVGDLTESWFKRTSAIKDSGNTFTGHGGMLDIIDSLLFTTIVYYWFLRWLHPGVLG